MQLERRMKPLIVRALPSLVGVAIVLTVVLGGGYRSAHQADATPAVSPKFDMAVVSGGQPVGGSGCDTRNGAPTQKGDALCFASGGFTVEAQLTNPGPISGQVSGVQTVIAWTAGL